MAENKTNHKDVNKYLSSISKEYKEALTKLRKIIKTFIPDSNEIISYNIPTVVYHGMLVGYAAFKNHLSLFVMSNTLISSLSEELKIYKKTKSAIHFQPDKPIPASLVKKILKIRVAQNKARAKKNLTY